MLPHLCVWRGGELWSNRDLLTALSPKLAQGVRTNTLFQQNKTLY